MATHITPKRGDCKMKLTMEQYITNPMQSPILTATMRESMRSSYIKKFNALLLREHGVINYFLYKDEEHNKYYAYFKIPSETIERFYYDTIIEFSADHTVKEAGNNLFKYNVRFYSNDPSFVYSYAYVFSRKGLFINQFADKMSQRALREPAKEKNPANQVGYVKTIYFAYLFMKLRSFNDLDKFKAQASVLNIGSLIATVMPADQKLGEREDAGERLSRKKEIAKKKAKREEEAAKKKASELAVKYTKKSGTGNIKTTSIVKTTKTTKRTKRK